MNRFLKIFILVLVMAIVAKAKIQATRVFYETQAATTGLVINRGGTRSTKSHSVMQNLCHKFFTEKAKKILIVRKTAPSLRISTWPLFKKVLLEFGMTPNDLHPENQMMNYYYKDNLLHMGGMDDPGKLKSTEWNYEWYEEATDFSKPDFMTLRLYNSNASVDGKLNQIYLTFNPIDEYHWIKTDVIDNPDEYDKTVIHSNYKDNPFLPQWYIQKLLDLERQDPNFYRIYTLGEWGKLENIIFTNWSSGPFPYDPSAEIVYGIDFGYNNPSTLVEISVREDLQTIQPKTLLYESELTNQDLIAKMERLIPSSRRSSIIYADSAEPQRIEEIARAGFNILGYKKGAGSVRDGIDFLKRWRLEISESDENMLKEIRSYSWRSDRNGKVMDEPVKFNDHLIDPLRGAMYTHYQERVGEYRISFLG